LLSAALIEAYKFLVAIENKVKIEKLKYFFGYKLVA
jgi:hypothetical protein